MKKEALNVCRYIILLLQMRFGKVFKTSYGLEKLDLSRIMMIRTPQIVHFGVGARKELVNEAKRLRINNLFIVTDEPLVKAGVIKSVTEILDDAKISYSISTDSAPEPTDIVAKKVIEKGSTGKFNGVLGIGGGSNMDIAKLVATAITNPMPLEKFYGADQIPKPGLPVILMPTTAGTGSEVTDVSVITDSKTSSKNAIFSRYLLATTAIIDPELTISCPPSVTANSGMDALCHAIEARWSLIGYPLTSWIALEAIKRIGHSLRTAVKDGKNIESRSEMAYAAYVAALAFAQAGVTSVHAASYPLGIRYHLPHGLANALMLSSIMDFNVETVPTNLADTARALGVPDKGQSDVELARAGVKAVKQLAHDIGIPDGLRKLTTPVKKEELRSLAEDMMNFKRLTVRNPRPIGVDEAYLIYQNAY